MTLNLGASESHRYWTKVLYTARRIEKDAFRGRLYVYDLGPIDGSTGRFYPVDPIK